jgi:hypothetical protein
MAGGGAVRDACAMSLLGARLSGPPGDPRPTLGREATPAASVRRRHAAIAPAARSCCCLGAPVAQVVMCATDDRPHETDLLLCAHHLRASAAVLTMSGTLAFDRDGDLIDDASSVFTSDGARSSASSGS